MNVSIFSQIAYENIANWTLGENKPNQTQSKPVLSAVEWANFRKAQMNVNSLITKDYRKKDDFAVRKNKPNSNPIQTQSNPICRMSEVRYLSSAFCLLSMAMRVNPHSQQIIQMMRDCQGDRLGGPIRPMTNLK